MRKDDYPVEFVVSRMELKDQHGGIAVGYIVTPRYPHETDERFCGRQGNLDIRIETSTSLLKDAYGFLAEEFRKMKEVESLTGEMDEVPEDDDDEDLWDQDIID